MKVFEDYRRGRIASALLDRVVNLARLAAEKLGRPLIFMEVCGTHTTAISRLGLRQVLKGALELRSGPGCPVCVTSPADIDSMIQLAGLKGVTVLTFGDMLRVPGSGRRSLEKARAEGAAVKVVYSPFQGVEMASSDPSTQYIMLGIGFETTAPMVAASIKDADCRGLGNYSVYSAHKVIPPALHSLLGDPETKLDGLILPGHVAAITGWRAFRFVSDRYQTPSVVAGFEPVDILGAAHDLIVQVMNNEASLKNGYTRVVREKGNRSAQYLVRDVFGSLDASWRGFGVITGGGLALNARWRQYDAAKKFNLTAAGGFTGSGCRCGDLLRGKISPRDCRLFGGACTPSYPVGPCMVSSEGACSAYFQHEGKDLGGGGGGGI